MSNLNLHLYTFTKFLRAPQLVCVIFLKKRKNPYFFFLKKDENIRNHVCFGMHCIGESEVQL